MNKRSKSLEASLIEQQFWLLNQNENAAAYNVNSVFYFNDLDFSKFVTAVNAVVKNNDILASRYQLLEGKLLRLKGDATCTIVEREFEIVDSESDEEANHWINQKCFDKFYLEYENFL